MNGEFCLTQFSSSAAVEKRVAGVDDARAWRKADADSWSILEVKNLLAEGPPIDVNERRNNQVTERIWRYQRTQFAPWHPEYTGAWSRVSPND